MTLHPSTGVATDPVLAWFAVNTQTGREMEAAGHLVRQSFEVFVPLFEKTVRHARKLSRKRAAFFPGYLFVRFDPGTTRWRSINGTRGVRSLVMMASRPAPLPAGVVAALKAATNGRGLVEPDRALAPGDRVRLLAGPFADLPGMITELTGPERVRVLVDLLNGRVPVVLGRSDIVRLAEPAGAAARSRRPAA